MSFNLKNEKTQKGYICFPKLTRNVVAERNLQWESLVPKKMPRWRWYGWSLVSCNQRC